ncbi:nuclear fusion protein fus2 [Anaeramoeba flamelloides]|uniref:Nuclear fusion protein fus2 n=1 Tax=Anaeramoeba flamelloides TaxID=1746091 RepID=A0ABQ8X7S9_9EUKA|nr:nuclear fusion protein fus2 [Anaeramoeba flamelloides]
MNKKKGIEKEKTKKKEKKEKETTNKKEEKKNKKKKTTTEKELKSIQLIQSAWRRYSEKQILKHLRERRLILNELVQTEERYLSYLKSAESEFFQPFFNHPQYSLWDHSGTFLLYYKNFESIISYHATNLSQFQSQEGNEKKTKLQQFLEIIPDITTLSIISLPYCLKYENFILAIRQLIRESPLFERFYENKNKLMVIDLMSVIISPISRIPRYVLLMRGFLKNCPKTLLHYSDLVTLLEKWESTVNDFNKKLQLESSRKNDQKKNLN